MNGEGPEPAMGCVSDVPTNFGLSISDVSL